MCFSPCIIFAAFCSNFVLVVTVCCGYCLLVYVGGHQLSSASEGYTIVLCITYFNGFDKIS